jgi:hypothetical protein
MTPFALQGPRNPAFLGQVPLLGAWTAPARGGILGQTKPAPGQQPQDMDRVVSEDEWANQPWTNKDEAVAAFNLVNLLRSAQDKLAFSTAVFGVMQSQPDIVRAMAKAGAAEQLSASLAALNALARKVAYPNAMASSINLRSALEVRILPKWGIGVKGVRPLFRNQRGLLPGLDPIRVDTTAGKTETIDFGDLSRTTIDADLSALQAASEKMQDIAPEVKLSGSSLGQLEIVLILVLVVIIVAIVAIVALAWLQDKKEAREAAKAPVTDPAVQAAIKNMCDSLPPDKRAECYIAFAKNASIMKSSEPTDVWVWVGLGAGAIFATWVVATLAGAFKK